MKFTNLDKIIYPSLRVTKQQIIEYYTKTAPMMLEFLESRALTVYRSPDGVDKEGFYEKDAPKGKPFWVKTFMRFSETARRDIEYIVCNDVETLAWLANLAAVEINIPLSRIDAFEKPDLALFDIDPEPPADFEDAVDAALLLKERLDLLGLKSYVKTSGKKGLHVVLPIVPNYTFKQIRAFVHQMGKFLASESDIVVSEFSQTKIPGTVFIDYTQNVRFKTMVCPYSLRANEHATVSTPLNWTEVRKSLKPEEFNILTVSDRKTHPWKGMFEQKQTLEFEEILTEKEYIDTLPEAISNESLKKKQYDASFLQEYIQKRDFSRTTEPRGSVIEATERFFVVQEHQTRKLHYDLRLAREGVLKSWAVPKGIPETTGIRRLAVQTEDHPLEYAGFEGEIPEGQYGAGTVKIWDKGSYELKTWTDDKIEFFLKGEKLKGKYALIRTKKLATKPSRQKEWLIIRTHG